MTQRRPRGAPDLERILLEPERSFRFTAHDFPAETARWNYHPEYELHLVRVSGGMAFVGDHIGPFAAGNLVLVGSNLPHHWESERAPGEVFPLRDVVLQFDPAVLLRAAEVLPEVGQVRRLLHAARRGIEFGGEAATRGAELLLALGEARGLAGLARFLELLGLLAAAPEQRPLASVGYAPSLDREASQVVQGIMAYVLENLTGHLRMSEAARLAGLGEPAFSRWFKRHTGNTFVDYVRKLRVAAACKLLAGTDLPVTEVCFGAGYRNLSNFNRRFLAEKGLTPTAYRRLAERTSAVPVPVERPRVRPPAPAAASAPWPARPG